MTLSAGRRRVLGAAAGGILCALLLHQVGCGRPQAESSAQSPSPERARIRVGYRPYLSYAPFFIAIEEGFFKEQGIDVELVVVQRTGYGFPMLARGDLDVLAGSVNAGLFNAIARGAPIRVVADKGHVTADGPPQIALFARRGLLADGTLSDPSRVKQVRVLVNNDNGPAYITEKALERLGIGADQIVGIGLSASVRTDALEKGRAEFLFASEPWVTRTLDSGVGEIACTGAQATPGLQFGCFLFGPSLLRDRPDLGRRFMVAYLKGVRRHNEGKTDRNVETLARFTRLEPDFLRRAGWFGFRDDGRIEVQGLLDFQEWALKRGLVERRIEPDEFWDPRFVDYACSVLDAPRNIP